MNVQFISKDSEAKVFDEDNNDKNVENTDNLEKILIKENLIDEIEIEIEQLNKEVKNYKKTSLFVSFFPLIVSIAIPLVLVPIILYNLGDWNDILPKTILGTNKIGPFLTMFTTSVLAMPGTLFSLMNLSVNKEKDKEHKAREVKLEFLNKELEKQKELLTELKNDKTLSDENKELKIVEVDDLQQIKRLKACLQLCQQIAFNEKKWYKYYQEGKVDKKLEKYWNDSEVEIVKDYFEEKAPVLSKKYSKK